MGEFLPYTLTINKEITYTDELNVIRFKAFGDSEGKGAWYFNPVKDGTEIVFDWRVTANKKVTQRFSFLLKPLFRANHHYCVTEAVMGHRADLIRLGKLQPV